MDHLIVALPHFVAVADAVGPRIGEVLEILPYDAAPFQKKMISVLDRCATQPESRCRATF